MAEQARPGRRCPLAYRYGAAALRAADAFQCETLYVAGGLYGNPFALDALPLHFDAPAWAAHFLARWPAGSDAHASYFNRITDGPRYEPSQALRLNQPLQAEAAE